VRIGIDVTVLGKHGGIPTYTLRLVRALLRLRSGHYFFLYSRSPGASQTAQALLTDEAVLVTASRPRRILGDFGEYGWGGLLSLSRTTPLDVVHGPNYGVPLQTPHARRIVTVHDLSVLRYPEWHTRLRVALLTRVLGSTIPRVDRVITDCESVRREVIDHFGLDADCVVSVPHAAPPRFRPLAPQEVAPTLARWTLTPGEYLLYAGAIEPRKNLLRLLAAHARISSKTDTPPLVLVGPPGWRNEEIQRNIGNSRGTVRYLGYVPDEDLPQLMAGAAVFVYPSLYEGFGLPALESLACGTPTVLSRIGALEEIAAGAAVFVDPLREDAIAEGIQRVLTDSVLQKALRSAGPARARQYSWERTARETLAVYESATHDARLSPARL
jgi:glycosyltransferase involved in cell wall biosynthesis